MSITSLTITWKGDDLYTVAWTSSLSDQTFALYVNDLLTWEGTATSADLRLDGGDLVQVLDDDEALAAAYPVRATLNWQNVTGAATYRVDEYVGSEWIARQTIQDDGSGDYTWTSRILADDTTHQFRVYALDAAGNESIADELDVFMVRHPDAPVIDSASYSSVVGEVTISVI